MSGFRSDLKFFINDFTGLVGVTPNPIGWSSGNPIVETATAYVFLKKLGILQPSDALEVSKAFSYCLPSVDSFYTKTPFSQDNASHDDIVGLVAGYSVCGEAQGLEFLEEDIIQYGKRHFWVLSTSGKFYWDALTKPWNYAYYMLAAGHNPGFIAQSFLALAIIVDALANKNNSSDKKLIWLMLETLKGDNRVVKWAASVWRRRLITQWGSLENVFKTYYGPNHLFTLYAGALK